MTTMTKVCSMCGERKHVDEFAFRSSVAGTRRSECRDCHNKKKRDYYKKANAAKTKHYEGQKVRTREHRLWLREQKNKPCFDCGVKYPYYVMQFDHVRGEKEFTIAYAASYSKKRLLNEMAKCDLVCANCHSERTYSRKQHIDSNLDANKDKLE